MSQITLGLFAAFALFFSCGVEKSPSNQALNPVSNPLPNTTETSGTILYSGTRACANRAITIDTSVVYSTCGGGCGSSDAQDYIYTHAPKLTLEGEVYSFEYHTGWTKQFAYSLPTYRWDGYFTGARDGSLERTLAANVPLDMLETRSTLRWTAVWMSELVHYLKQATGKTLPLRPFSTSTHWSMRGPNLRFRLFSTASRSRMQLR
jgi:hypothetical protein